VHSDEQGRKIGRTQGSSQRYQCRVYGRRYTPEPKVQGYDEGLRLQAVRLYADGMNYRRIGHQLGVSHQSVINWVNTYQRSTAGAAAVADKVGVVEMDELFTFIEEKNWFS
jgi:transposase-like protein